MKLRTPLHACDQQPEQGNDTIAPGTPAQAVLSVETPAPPPDWALLERELIRAQSLACETFFNRYFDERGYLQCVPRWGGNWCYRSSYPPTRRP